MEKCSPPRQFKPWPCMFKTTNLSCLYFILLCTQNLRKKLKRGHGIWYSLKKKNCLYHKKTANCQPSHSFKGFHSKRIPCSIRWMVKLYTPLETQYPENYSPHSKHFCYRIFSFGWAKKWNESQTKKEGSEKETLADKLWDFENLITSKRGAWLAQLVEHYWHQSIKDLIHAERLWHAY